jgi:DNA-binding MarR family transcriptional regulator
MVSDFITEQGYRALDNRLKRISDRMSHDTRKFYKEIAVDVEPSWHLIFKLLRNNEFLTMVEIAERLGYSHPSMVVMLKKMTAKGYLVSEKDQNDKRKLKISLTQKSRLLLPQLEKIWAGCEQAIFQLLQEDLSILKMLDRIETALNNVPLNERFYTAYQKVK